MSRYRLAVVAVGGAVAILFGVLLFGNLNGNLVYYLTPDEALARQGEFTGDRRFQLGGLVVADSVEPTPAGLTFQVTSSTAVGAPTVQVEHRGAPAQLFQAGTGVVLEGSWRGGAFVSDTMIVKHDENYRASDGAGSRTGAP